MSTVKVYKISNDLDDKVFFGSTTSPLPVRLSKLKQESVKQFCNTPVHAHIRSIGKDHFKIELVETMPNDRDLINQRIKQLELASTVRDPKDGDDTANLTQEHADAISVLNGIVASQAELGRVISTLCDKIIENHAKIVELTDRLSMLEKLVLTPSLPRRSWTKRQGNNRGEKSRTYSTHVHDEDDDRLSAREIIDLLVDAREDSAIEEDSRLSQSEIIDALRHSTIEEDSRLSQSEIIDALRHSTIEEDSRQRDSEIIDLREDVRKNLIASPTSHKKKKKNKKKRSPTEYFDLDVEPVDFNSIAGVHRKTGEDIRVDEINDMKKEYDGVLKKMRHLKNHEFDLENCEYLEELKRNLYMSCCILESEYKLDENSYKTIDRIKKFVK